jgi:hypothetical protein
MGRDRLVAEATAAQVVERRLARLRGRQDRVVEGDRRLEHISQSRLASIVPAGPLVQLDPGLGGQLAKGLRERHTVALHDEAENVAAEAATEAVPAVADRGDHERGRLLAVERAEPLVGGTGLLEADRLADHVHDVEPVLHLGRDADRQARLRRRSGFTRSRPAGHD